MMLGAHQLSCRRGGKTLFEDISFTLDSGQSLLLSGPNGIGKSSLLRLLARLLPPASGKVACVERVALADEHSALDTGKPLREALGFWADMDGASPSALDCAMAHYGLEPLADVPVRMLSTGQRKRATLARVMAGSAPVWLLDEPGNGLDGAALSALGAAMEAHLSAGGVIVAASHFDLPHGLSSVIDLSEAAA
ncbi:MAG: heme ABC exporter ATP-binding protein CcmA [Sphingobium sp.]